MGHMERGARIERIELHRVGLRLRTPVRTAYGVEDHRDVVLVRLLTDQGEGWGECAALPEPTYASEYVAGALHVLERHLGPRLLGAAVVGGDVTPLLHDVVGHPMARSTLAMAALDAHLCHAGRSLADHLGAPDDVVAAGVTIGIDSDLGRLRDTVAQAVDAGYRNVKLKVRPGWDVEPVTVARAAAGVASLVVDANGSYGAGDRDALHALDDAGADVIEQPGPTDALDDHAALTATLTTPVALDEDVTSVGVVRLVGQLAAARAVAIKPGRFGSLPAALAAARVARGLGLGCWVGGMYETGIGRAANLALAACDAFDRPVDWSASDRYWDRDVTEPHVLRDGRLAVPSGPGLGVSPDVEWIAAQTRESRVVAAR